MTLRLTDGDEKPPELLRPADRAVTVREPVLVAIFHAFFGRGSQGTQLRKLRSNPI
jgi:hypothetical protein